MKNHLKRITVPTTWSIDRKTSTFIMRPRPGAHPIEMSLPLGIVLKDFLKCAQTTREAKKVCNNQEILIDGKRKKEVHLPVGLFDVISMPTKEDYRMVFDIKGRLVLQKIDAKEKGLKPCKIKGKVALSKHIQLNLHDGSNILVEKDFKCNVGDSVLITLPDRKVKELLPLKKDCIVFITDGKRRGDSGSFIEVKEDRAVYQKDEAKIETAKRYLFVIGDKKSAITI